MEKVLELLHAVKPLAPDLREYISGIIRKKVIPKKAFLLKAGHVCQNIYFIRKGILRSYYMKDDIEVCSWFMKEMDLVISIDSFYNQTPGNEYLQALEETEVWYISYTELQRIYRDFPDFNVHGRILTQKYHQHWAGQLFAIRMQTAEERYQWLMENHPELLLRVPAKYIATYLDIAEVTLSKIKSRK